MDKLVVCLACQRHVKEHDARCPFCRSAMPGARAVSLVGAVAVGVGLSLAACGNAVAMYGGPPWDGGPAVDSGTDADGGMLGAYGPPPPQDAGLQ